MTKLYVTFGIARNVFIALVSVAWIYPLFVSIRLAIDTLRPIEVASFKTMAQKYFPSAYGPSFSVVDYSIFFAGIGCSLLAVAIFFWAIVIANRLWPIRASDKVEKTR